MDAGDKPIFTTLADHPIRPGEARALFVEDLLLNRRGGPGLHIHKTWSVDEIKPKRKRGKPYVIPLTDRAITVITRDSTIAPSGLAGRWSLRTSCLLTRRPRAKPAAKSTAHIRPGWAISGNAIAWPPAWRRARCTPSKLDGADGIDAGATTEQLQAAMGHGNRSSTDNTQRDPTRANAKR